MMMIGKSLMLLLLAASSFINVVGIVAKLEPMPTMCGYRYGTCVLDSDGDITCTLFPRHPVLKGFTYPKTTHPTGDKFVGLACDSGREDMCALLASGRFICYWKGENHPLQHPKYDDGFQTAKKGKFVFINLSPDGSTHSLAAIRDDGKMETWGHWANRMTGMPGDGTLYKDGGKLIIPNPGNKIVNAGSPGNFGAYLESNGTITNCRYGQPWTDEQSIALGAKHNVASFMKSNGMSAALKSDGTYGVITVGYGKSKIMTAKSGKFVRGGCAGGWNICALTDQGKVQCWDEAFENPVGSKWIPEEWAPSTGKFVACGCGKHHTCCAKDDGVIECIGQNEEKNPAITYTAPVGATPPCNVSISAPVTTGCTCATQTTDCAVNKFCYDAGCKDNAKYPACPVHFQNPLTTICLCGSGATNSCAVGQWCYDGSCKSTAKCGVRTDVQKNLFYGAKVYGRWNATTRKMYMNFTTPWDVTVNKIAWQNAATDTMQYLSASSGLWTVDHSTNPCSPTYELDVPQTTFFGPGSKFKITGSQLKTNIRVDASETIKTVKNADTYTYTRSIKNSVPVLVNLVTETTISVRFRSAAAPPGPGPAPSLEDFVLFISAEDNFSDDIPSVKITMQVHSRTCVNHTAVADSGVRVKTGGDNIKIGSRQLFTWKKDANNKIMASFQHNLCVEELEWIFVPKQYKENTYEIELEFDSKNLFPQKFTTIAAIDIEQGDVLADIGFTSTIKTYSDEACATESGKFILGHKFYTKITLADLVVDATDITCNTYKIKQTKNGVTTVTDLKAEVKYAFMQKKADLNEQICGAELESHHFHVSVDGYDTVLETEITISYDQTNTRRQLISIPLTGEMFDDEIVEAGVGMNDDEIPEVGVAAATYDETDKQFQNTKRVDEDDMLVELFIEPAKNTAVGTLMEAQSTKILATLSLCVLIVGGVGFIFGYAQTKGKHYQIIPDDRSTLLVELNQKE